MKRPNLLRLLFSRKSRIVSDCAHLVSGAVVDGVDLRTLLRAQAQRFHSLTATEAFAQAATSTSFAKTAAAPFDASLHEFLLLWRKHTEHLLASSFTNRTSFLVTLLRC